MIFNPPTPCLSLNNQSSFHLALILGGCRPDPPLYYFTTTRFASQNLEQGQPYALITNDAVKDRESLKEMSNPCSFKCHNGNAQTRDEKQPLKGRNITYIILKLACKCRLQIFNRHASLRRTRALSSIRTPPNRYIMTCKHTRSSATCVRT